MLSESEFIAAADATLDAIAAALDDAQAADDADLDWNRADGILEIEGDADKLIVNRHVANREIWVAARSGGFHFAARDGRWRDTRNGEELGAALARLIEAHTGAAVSFGALTAP
jgi:CyaY protein